MGLLLFLVTLPISLVIGPLIFVALTTGSFILLGVLIDILILLVLISNAIRSAANVVFRALLYNYATGRTIPEEVDESMFASAFVGKA